MQLEGTLDKFPLRELIEMVIYSSVTGVLELRVGAEIGRLFFRDGRPYHALSGERAGIDAVTAMFEERDAPFRFVADRDSAEMTLWMDPWEMLDRGEAQALKWAAVRQHIASVDCVPTLLGGPPSGQIQISEFGLAGPRGGRWAAHDPRDRGASQLGAVRHLHGAGQPDDRRSDRAPARPPLTVRAVRRPRRIA